MNIQLIKVKKEDKKKLKNLLSLYLHELSQYTDDLFINEDGIFLYDSLDLFFEEENLIPYFLQDNNKTIGFILLSKAPYTKKGTDLCIQEFFILNAYCKQGLGQLAILEVMKAYKGKIALMVLEKNKKAMQFWHHFYDKYQIPYEEGIETHPHYKGCLYQIFKS